MGLGDALMAAGEARLTYARYGKQVCITRIDGRPLWSEVWENVPYISHMPGPGIINMVNCGGCRPYIESKTSEKWTWRAYKPIPAEIILTSAEWEFVDRYRGMILLEPNIKTGASPNKQWPWGKWMHLARQWEPACIQVGPPGTKRLPSVEFVQTDTFRKAAAVLSVCSAAILHEGALHHAAAALNVPAIVIRGEYISPQVTGYEGQIDFFVGDGLGCGARIPCKGCAKAMDLISVDMVLENFARLL